jgi:hypothetical protein
MSYDEFSKRINVGSFVKPHLISDGDPLSIDEVMLRLNIYGFHGATEPTEGAVWRVERNVLNDKNKGNLYGRHSVVDFLVKYVHPAKVDGKYLGGDTIYNKYFSN